MSVVPMRGWFSLVRFSVSLTTGRSLAAVTVCGVINHGFV
ncbi:hypothetical protein HMPREF9337_00607 [Cutibacterium acnes HL096PA3]|nr:hypothetical protein HMPREF9600_00528 [Cutibacterium acnes HL050PA3]EFS95112.1 hypothetical protein HMPREF9608_01405 [Cutibacterium acnes HL067PA1]EFT59773.1 hypothetical protein HMPREF9572_02097 [Cutibacterium acnes HL072PA1]EFT73764.1 hypothetical protein HMPREF9592_01464 [Cutibacterium acnes HL046PA1]EGE75171.1 hypothetical protein HMPREF9337_00607 [Cutibacterium acnes HL096PA3]EGF01321.1 hypothetical protein HMPREF9581_00842 [Cutibacterium acnes HL087PA3]